MPQHGGVHAHIGVIKPHTAGGCRSGILADGGGEDTREGVSGELGIRRSLHIDTAA